MGEHETKEEVGEIISCDCVEWREAGLFPYRAPKRRFRYCPWCGKELEEKKEEVRTCACEELMGTGQIDVLYCPVCKRGTHQEL